MTEAELQAIERLLPADVPQRADAFASLRAADVRALIAEVRRLRQAGQSAGGLQVIVDGEGVQRLVQVHSLSLWPE
jgi:hypothetical protein